MRCSNSLVGILNVFVFLFSIPILAGGIWLRLHGSTQCESFFDKPIIALGVFLMIVAIAGVVGSCCRVKWLLWFYLFVMFFLIVIVLCFTIFAFVVSSKGSGGETIPGKAYKEYRLEAYSNWMQRRVSNAKNWNSIRSCLYEEKSCTRLEAFFSNETVSAFYQHHLSPIESGCCKPSNDCNFIYVSPTTWNKTTETQKNPDCKLWDSDNQKLCYDCQACKAGLLNNLVSSGKIVAILNIIFLVILIIVYTMGVCAFRNNKREESYERSNGF
ncbi:unnamed protein product [Microthlaspi erraticum]|uniref:Tetraspanin n=1 Tax=Microthlaspi erraticum TaxID=1685480 RepID=A0A6D2KMG2_9BRAS|nr:unnamed protein product [Microthlaspi erraticum]